MVLSSVDSCTPHSDYHLFQSSASKLHHGKSIGKTPANMNVLCVLFTLLHSLIIGVMYVVNLRILVLQLNVINCTANIDVDVVSLCLVTSNENATSEISEHVPFNTGS